MHKLITILLLVAFAGQTFNQGWYYLSYVIEKKEYMKRCENRTRPQLNCNGKCQLMRKIKELQEKEQGQPPELKLAAKLEIVSPDSIQSPGPIKLHDITGTFLIRTIGFPIHRSSSTFHPPNIA